MLLMLLDKSIFPLCGPELEVYCSEVVEMNSEYAVYVVDGSIRAICHYMCKKSSCRCAEGDRAKAGERMIQLDMAVVDQAIQALSTNLVTKSMTGYRADFALFETS